ncbi:DUF6233 domain-containing protein [Streptomyces phaeoluteigriseus]|uniref:DUF6233 domain-containing protein n=1 Tax=Streptomyces phaeoluteigriseus TaxID=114686 RepID=UPI0036965188
MHRPSVPMAGKRRRTVGRDEASRLPSGGLRVCTHCRPEARLDIIHLSDGSIPHRSSRRTRDTADAPTPPASVNDPAPSALVRLGSQVGPCATWQRETHRYGRGVSPLRSGA